MTYTYGDIETLRSDVKILNEILEKQGPRIFLECIGEKIGSTANTSNLSDVERKRLIHSLLNEFKETLLERL